MGKLSEFKSRLKNGLTGHQKKYYDAIKWLMSMDMDTRRSGRTYLMAVAAIEEAMNNPGIRIYLRDHFPNRRADIDLSYAVKNLIRDADQCPPYNLKLWDRFAFYRDGSFSFGPEIVWFPSAETVDMDIQGGIFEFKNIIIDAKINTGKHLYWV